MLRLPARSSLSRCHLLLRLGTEYITFGTLENYVYALQNGLSYVHSTLRTGLGVAGREQTGDPQGTTRLMGLERDHIGEGGVGRRGDHPGAHSKAHQPAVGETRCSRCL